MVEKVAKTQAEQAALAKLPRLSAVPRKPWYVDGGFTAVSVRNDSPVTPAPIVAVTFRVHLPEMQERIESRIPRKKGPHQAVAPEAHRPFVFKQGYWSDDGYCFHCNKTERSIRPNEIEIINLRIDNDELARLILTGDVFIDYRQSESKVERLAVYDVPLRVWATQKSNNARAAKRRTGSTRIRLVARLPQVCRRTRLPAGQGRRGPRSGRVGSLQDQPVPAA